MASSPITSWHKDGKTMETVTDIIFLGSKITAHSEIKRCLLFGRKAMTNLDSIFTKQRHHFANKGPYIQSFGFSSSQVQMWELDCKEGWVPKNRWFQIMLLEKILESPLDCKIKQVNPKGIQPWIFIGRTNAETEAPILWPYDVKSWLIGKDPDAGKDWRQRRKDQQRMGWLYSITDSMDMNLNKLWETVTDREAWQTIVHGVTKSQTQLSNWKTIN